MNKKLITMIAALALCAVIVIGTTLAYFSTVTDEVKNTFTYSAAEDPKPEIEEPGWEEDDPDPISPEKYFTKDPIVTLKKAGAITEQYYVAMVITGTSDNASLNSLKAILNYGGAGGIAKIDGWNTANYDFQIDESTGTVYAYYKTLLKDDNKSSTAVFKGVKFNKELTGLAEDDTLNIDIKGYVVSSINDTNSSNAAWGSSKVAMQAAFPDVFTESLTDVTITTSYPNAEV